MKSVPTKSRHWWQTFVFVQETFLILSTMFFLAVAAWNIEIWFAPIYDLAWGYFVASVSLFITGIILIYGGQPKRGKVDVALAISTLILAISLVPYLFRARIH